MLWGIVNATHCRISVLGKFLTLQRAVLSLFVSKSLISIICLIAFFMWLNDFVCSSFQSSLLFFIFSLCASKGCSGFDFSDRLGINFYGKCILPINDLSCFSVFGGSNFIIDSVFLVVGMTPFGFFLYPNHVISVAGNSHLCRLIAKFSLSSRTSTLFSSVSWLVSFPFVMIIMSFKNACAELIFTSVKPMIFLECCRHIC